MFLPIRTDSPLRNTPYMNWALIVANVVAFVLQKTYPNFDVAGALYPHDPTLATFFSYAFLHAGVMHIVGNMLFLYIFGNNVNDKMGHVGYLAFYLAGAVTAGLGFVASADGPQPVIGASGAVAAVSGAYLVLLPYSTVTVFYMLFFIGTLELPGFVFILLFFLKDLFGLSGQADGVAYTAHVAGTLFGFGVCFVLLLTSLLPRDQFDVLALLSRWNKRRQYRDMVSKGYNPFDYAPTGRERVLVEATLDPKAERIAELRAEVAEAIAQHDLPRAVDRYTQIRQLDPENVLSRQAQLDVANQLSLQQRYEEAAQAYELFLKHYPKFEQIEQVELMLGLIYARYLNQPVPAKAHLLKASARLHGQRELEMARAELDRIEPLLGGGTPGGLAAG